MLLVAPVFALKKQLCQAHFWCTPVCWGACHSTTPPTPGRGQPLLSGMHGCDGVCQVPGMQTCYAAHVLLMQPFRVGLCIRLNTKLQVLKQLDGESTGPKLRHYAQHAKHCSRNGMPVYCLVESHVKRLCGIRICMSNGCHIPWQQFCYAVDMRCQQDHAGPLTAVSADIDRLV